MNAERNTIALSATLQIDAVLETLARTHGGPGFNLTLQAVLPRLLDLTSVVMSALDDMQAKPAELMLVVDRWGPTSST